MPTIQETRGGADTTWPVRRSGHAILPALLLLLIAEPAQAEAKPRSPLDSPSAASPSHAQSATPSHRPAPDIARLGRIPDWSRLDPWQETMGRAEFLYLLRHCYTRSDADFEKFIEIQHDRALIVKQSNHPESGHYALRFKKEGRVPADGPRYWRPARELDELPPNSGKPLQELVIALDPGHIGGRWVTWDDRHFKIGKDTLEVREGEMALRVAKILERDLSRLGATVVLTRESNNPVTRFRIEDLRGEARSYLLRKGKIPSSGLVERTAKQMFAISSEIRTRAELVNGSFRPDLALCLHFDASPWGSRPSFREANHLHLLVNGCYAEFEVAEDDTRFEMLQRILQRVYYEELALGHELTRTMRDETRLPAFSYNGVSGKSVSDDPYLWARNLLANRVFLCPVIFFEPHCMNHRETHARIQAGEYRGLREFNGIYRKNLYQEYADGITSGVVNYFRRFR